MGHQYNGIKLSHKLKKKNTPDTRKFANVHVQLIRMGKSIKLKRVKCRVTCYFVLIIRLSDWMKNQQNECARSLIRVFAVRMKKHWVFSYPMSAQRRLWSDLIPRLICLRWAHTHFVGFVMSCVAAQTVLNKTKYTLRWTWAEIRTRKHAETH